MNWRSERGSVTPVWVFILGMVVLLGVAVVEREWANYKLKMLEQTLDFAAEAAGRTHEGYAWVDVPVQQYYYVNECVEQDLDGVCIYEPVLHGPEPDVRHIQGNPTELEANWRALAQCGSDPMAPNWECLTPVVTRYEMRFTIDTDRTATQTFWGNWRNQPTAFVHPSSLTISPGPQQDFLSPARYMDVSAEIEMRPLFGLVPWVHSTWKRGRAVVRLHELVLE